MEKVHMEKTDRQIFKEFAEQLMEWGGGGKTPEAGNQDIRYGLELQRKRLEKYHANIEYRLNQREDSQSITRTAEFSDVRYTNKLVWRSYQKETHYFKKGKKRLSLKDNEYLYTIITWLNQADTKAAYCCPNCGAVSNVNELLDGCPYCHTRFLMSDLFPKVTNFYFLRDYGLGEKEAKTNTRKWMTAGGALGVLIRLPGAVIDTINGGNLFLMLFTVLMAAGFFAVFGYFALSISLLRKVLMDGIKQAPRAVRQMDTKKRLTDFMKQFEPGFTFEYFFGKVQALVKIFIFTDDRSQLAIYEGDWDGHTLDHIIDAQFDGAVHLTGGRVEGEYCYLDMSVYMTDVFCRGSRLSRKSDRFRIGLCRNIARPVDYGFSIKSVNCKSCGASFDAARERSCPYCKSRYDLKEDDWVITYVKKG